jgi:hypothetical protein
VPPTFTLTRAQRADFELHGVLRLPGFFPAADIAAMADALWANLQRRFGIRRGAPDTWRIVRPAQFQALERSGAFAALGSPDLIGLADDLLGQGEWERPRRWGQPLVTFPAAAWDLPRVAWHMDYPVAAPACRPPAIRVFTFLEPVLPLGGGTVYVAGSHHVAMALARDEPHPVRSVLIRARLEARHPWFVRLWSANWDETQGLMGVQTEIGAAQVELCEMTGEPGDLIVMHPFMLHGLAHNALASPRLMLVQGLSRTA